MRTFPLSLTAAAAALLSTAAYSASRSAEGPPPGASSRPPSSIEVPRSSAVLSLAQERREITSCTLQSTPKERCEAVTRIVPVRAVVALTPIRDERVLTKSDPRKAVRISLGGPAPLVATVRLGVGAWYLDWQNSGVSAQIRVYGDDDFAVKLKTTVGACVLGTKRCRLVADSVDRTLDVPKAHREGR